MPDDETVNHMIARGQPEFEMYQVSCNIRTSIYIITSGQQVNERELGTVGCSLGMLVIILMIMISSLSYM